MSDSFSVFIFAAAGLGWAAFECWQRRRYRDAVLTMVITCVAIGLAVQAFYEATSN